MLKNSFHYIYLLIKMCFVQRMHRRHGARGYEADNLVSGVQTVLECAKESSGKIAGGYHGEADAEAVHENKPMIMQMKIAGGF